MSGFVPGVGNTGMIKNSCAALRELEVQRSVSK